MEKKLGWARICECPGWPVTDADDPVLFMKVEQGTNGSLDRASSAFDFPK